MVLPHYSTALVLQSQAYQLMYVTDTTHNFEVTFGSELGEDLLYLVEVL